MPESNDPSTLPDRAPVPNPDNQPSASPPRVGEASGGFSEAPEARIERAVDDIELRFDHHRPSSNAVIELHGDVRYACATVAIKLVREVPPCRELSLALTKLEEAMMWANAAIARHISAPANRAALDALADEPSA